MFDRNVRAPGLERTDLSPEPFEDAEFLGSVLTSSATPDLLQFTMSVPVRQLAEAAELLGDVVQEPSFQVDAFEAERAVADLAASAVRGRKSRRARSRTTSPSSA